MNVRVEKKGQSSEQPHKVVCGAMLVNARSGAGRKNAAHSRTEWPTGALVGAGLLWPDSGT